VSDGTHVESDRASVSCILIGDELLDGRISDVHGSFVVSRCSELGSRVVGLWVVGDDRAQIARCVAEASRVSDVVVCAGGLGPTSDDVTRDAVADAVGADLVHDDAAEARLREKFARFGREMPETNLRQVRFPRSAQTLPSAIGTADAFRASLGDAHIVCLPGVPYEFRSLFETYVQPMLNATERTARTIATLGVGESDVGARIERLSLPEGVLVSYRADTPIVYVRLSAPATQTALVDRAEAEVRAALSPWCVVGPYRNPCTSLVDALRQRGMRVATAESCTGGRIAAEITSVPGASDVFDGGVVTYANRIKTSLTHVNPDTIASHGAVSSEVALEMAAGARDMLGADIAIAVSGIAGPSGATQTKPVGTVWIAVATTDVRRAWRFVFSNRSRGAFISLTAQIALQAAARVLSGDEVDIERWAGFGEVVDGTLAADVRRP